MALRAFELLADGFFLSGSTEGDAFAGVGDLVGCPELEGWKGPTRIAESSSWTPKLNHISECCPTVLCLLHLDNRLLISDRVPRSYLLLVIF